MAVFNGQFFSRSLKRIVPFSALIPVDRMEQPGIEEVIKPEKAKTLYLLHGYSGSHTDWLYGSSIQDFSLQYGISVIMPSGGNSFYLDQKEYEELYGEFIAVELPEFAEKVFNIPDSSESRYLGGLSMGGFGALRNGLKYHDRFNGIIALSSALITNRISGMQPGNKDAIASYDYYRSVFGDLSCLPESENSPEFLVHSKNQDNIKFPDIYMACGTEDFLINENREFHSYLSKHAVTHEYAEGPGAHDWRFWNTYIEKAIQWMLKA